MRRFIIATALLAALPAHAEEDVVAKLKSTPASAWDVGVVRFQQTATPKIQAIAKEHGYKITLNSLFASRDGQIQLSLGAKSDQPGTPDRIIDNCASILREVRRDVFLINESDQQGDDNAHRKYAAFFSHDTMRIGQFEALAQVLLDRTTIALGIENKNLNASCSWPLAGRNAFFGDPSPN